MIVYVVFRYPHDYDADIDILGAFSSRIKAEEYISTQPGDILDWSEFVLDKEIV